MLTIRNLRKSVGGRLLFEDADMTINYGEKVALVGPNGAGKTTLFGLILGYDEPDSGTIERDEWTTTGFLPQEAEDVGDVTVMDIATGRAGELAKLESRLSELEGEGQVDVPEYYEVQAKFDILNDPALGAKAQSMLRGLAFKESDFERPVKEFSGGWIMRAHLARLLAMEPDLLMLDEPTNHLDLVSLLWLRDYLRDYPGALLMISHDRDFMDATVGQVHEIADQKLIAYKGNYSDYESSREKRFEDQHARWKNQQKEISQVQDFIDKFRSVSSKASQVQSRVKQLEKLERVPKPNRPKKPFKLQFPEPPRGGQKSVELSGIDFGYRDDELLYEGLDLIIERGERVVLVGPNGAGKSTLMKIMADELTPQAGDRQLGHNVKLGYFSQHRSEALNPANTVLQEVLDAAPAATEQEARGVLGCFGFRKEEVFKKTEVLSGGEKSRLNLIKFLVDPPNVLLMDEPTTHLDLLTVESLILALQDYQGTLVFISHDVHFIKKLANRVLHINNGRVRNYPGGYQYFIDKTGADDDREALTATID